MNSVLCAFLSQKWISIAPLLRRIRAMALHAVTLGGLYLSIKWIDIRLWLLDIEKAWVRKQMEWEAKNDTK